MLDFLFGRTKAVPTTTTTIQTSKLPEEIAPYVTQVLEEAQKQYEIARDEGYQKYPGETIAPRTQAELDAIAGLQGLVGGQEKYIQEAEDALRGIGTEFTAEQAEKFMSPYQQAVVDVEKRKAQEDFERRIMPEFERQAVGAGGMSGLGSRAGVQAARLGEAFGQQLGDIQTRGSQKAFEDAYRQFTDQGARQRARAADLQNIGLTRFQTGLAEQGLAQQLAQADRAETQATYDEAFREYLEQEQYPESELAQFSSFVYGNPYLRQPDTTKTVQGMLQPTTSMGQGLLNLGLTGLNIYGRGTLGGTQPFSIGSAAFPYAKMKTGGGLRSLPVVKRAVPGQIGKIPNYLPPVANQALQALSENLTTGLPGRKYNPRQLSGMRKERIRDDIRRQGLRFAKRKAETERLGTKGIEDYAQSQAGILEAMNKGGLSGPILKAQEALTEKGMEDKGFLNQLAAAYNAFAAAQDVEGMKRAEKKAEIEGKKVELQANLDRALLDIENKKADEINTLERKIDDADNESEKEESELARKTAIEDQTNTRQIASAVAEFIKTNATLYSNMATRAKNNRLTSSDIKEITSQVARSFGYRYDPDDGSLSTGSGKNLKTVKRDDPIYTKLTDGVTAFTKIMVTAIEEQGKTKGQAYQLGMEDQLKRDIIRTAQPQPTDSSEYKPGVYYYNPVDGKIVRGTGDLAKPFEIVPGLIKKYRKRRP